MIYMRMQFPFLMVIYGYIYIWYHISYYAMPYNNQSKRLHPGQIGAAGWLPRGTLHTFHMLVGSFHGALCVAIFQWCFWWCQPMMGWSFGSSSMDNSPNSMESLKRYLVGGFKQCLFSVLCGIILNQLTSYVSRWLKPPTRYCQHLYRWIYSFPFFVFSRFSCFIGRIPWLFRRCVFWDGSKPTYHCHIWGKHPWSIYLFQGT